MGFIIVAKGKQTFFILSEVAWAIASIALAWLCILRFGLSGAGIAFLDLTFSRIPGVSNCAPSERIQMVERELAHRSALYLTNRPCVLWILLVAFPRCRFHRNYSAPCKQHLFYMGILQDFYL